MTEVTFDYEPRPAFMPFHTRGTRWAIMVCHRRAGKTVACINDLIAKAVYTKKKNARFAYIAPFYRQAKDVAWEYLKQYAAPVLRGKPKESILRVELFNGAWITLYGADNPNAFRGLYFDGVVIDEYGDMRPKLWSENILPTLADRKGWAAFIGTPKGPNHFKEAWTKAQTDPNWFHLMLKASESGILSADELRMQRSLMAPDEYDQEYECSFDAAVTGTFYAKLLNEYYENWHIDVPWNPSEEVQVAMDIGRKDSAAAWFWQEGADELNLIRYEQRSGSGAQEWIEFLKSLPYTFSSVWLPHDAVAKTFATKRSTVEQFKDAGLPVKVVPQLAVQHGIDAARLIIPICYFDQNACFEGIQALLAYRRKWDDAKKIFSKEPMHDWASDGADAFRYFALVAKQGYGSAAINKRMNADRPPKDIIFRPPAFTLDQLFQDRDEELARTNIVRIR